MSHQRLLSLRVLFISLPLTTLAACGGDLSGGLLPSGGAVVTPVPVVQCTDPTANQSLAGVDLAGQCRANPPTMGALEASG
jgi:hypothetical protein